MKERSGILRRWFDLMMENQEDLAKLMTLEQGKPLAGAGVGIYPFAVDVTLLAEQRHILKFWGCHDFPLGGQLGIQVSA